MLYLDKLLAQFAYPLGLALTLSLLALFARGRRRWGGILLLAAVGWLWFWSLPIVSDTVRHTLEGQFPNAPIATLPPADVIVALGGGINAGPPDRPYPDLGAAADRIWHAARSEVEKVGDEWVVGADGFDAHPVGGADWRKAPPRDNRRRPGVEPAAPASIRSLCMLSVNLRRNGATTK